MKKGILSLVFCLMLLLIPIKSFSVEFEAKDYDALTKDLKALAAETESDTLDVIEGSFDDSISEAELKVALKNLDSNRTYGETNTTSAHASLVLDPNFNNTVYYPGSLVVVPFYLFPNEKAGETYTIYIQNASTRQMITTVTKNFTDSKDATYLALDWNTQGLPAGNYEVYYFSTYGAQGKATVVLNFSAVALTGIGLDQKDMIINNGESRTINVYYNPYATTNCKTILWESSDSKVISLNATLSSYSATYNGNNCTVTAKDFGSSKITACSVVDRKNITSGLTVSVRDVAQVRNFVNRLYLILLNRPAEEAGLTDWANKLLNGNANAAQIVQGIASSPEFTNFNYNNSDIVERLYLSMLGRSPEAEGKNYWVTKLNSGKTINSIIKGFSESPEFTNICASYGIQPGTITSDDWADKSEGITGFVSRCYSCVLGRQGDAPGIEYWCKYILTSSDKKGAAAYCASTGFFHSQEFMQKGTTDEQYVTLLYKTFLNRDPDLSGMSDWLNRLRTGTSRDTVMYGFSGSIEFDVIMRSYGIY